MSELTRSSDFSLTTPPGPDTHGYPEEAFRSFSGNATEEPRTHELAAQSDFYLECGIVSKERAFGLIREAFPEVVIEQKGFSLRFRNCPTTAPSAERLLEMALVKVSEAYSPSRQDDINYRRFFARA